MAFYCCPICDTPFIIGYATGGLAWRRGCSCPSIPTILAGDALLTDEQAKSVARLMERYPGAMEAIRAADDLSRPTRRGTDGQPIYPA